MEGKPKKSKAFIVSLIAMIIIAIIVLLLFKNKDNLLGKKQISENNTNVFQSLFGTSKSKNLEVIESLNSGKDGVVINAEAGENIKKGDVLYQFGKNKNGDLIVKRVKSVLRNNSNDNFDLQDIDEALRQIDLAGVEIIGIALEDINNGEMGQILIPDFSLNTESGIWGTIKDNTINIFNTIKDLINKILDEQNIVIPTEDPEIPTNLNLPTVSITANPASVAVGESSIISWVSTDATSCMKDDGTEVEISGSFDTGFLTESRSYSIICSGANGSIGGNTTVIVGDNSIFNFPTVTVTAEPSNISENESSLISWTSTNSTFCMRDDGSMIDTEGSFDTGPLNSSNYYSIICTGEFGSASGSALITILNGTDDDYDQFFQCKDGVDNDEDGFIDSEDSGCHTDFDANNPDSYNENLYSESRSKYLPQCSDTIDNDNDELVDIDDPECYSDGEYNPDLYFEFGIIPIPTISPACSDELDNDGDGLTDIDDPECHTDRDNLNANSYVASNTSEVDMSGYLPQCSDFADNDEDGLIDIDDPSCHTDFNSNNKKSYTATLNDETLSGEADEDPCAILDDYALEFTDEEKSELKELLRKFYLIAPNLKSQDDINIVYNEAKKNKSLVSEVQSLTNECYTQTSDPTYAGPTLRYGNPWYKPEERGSYLEGVNTSEAYKNFIKSGLYDLYETEFKEKGMDEDSIDNAFEAWAQGEAEQNPNIYWSFEQIFNIW